MEKTEIEATVLRVIIEHSEAAQIANLAVTPEMTLGGEELGLDSLDVLEVAMELEQEFSIEVDDDEFSFGMTVAEATALIVKKIEARQ